MLLDQVAVPFERRFLVALQAVIIGQLQFDHWNAFDLEFFGEEDGESAGSGGIILDQTLGFTELVGGLRFEILIGADVDGAPENGRRLIVLFELDHALTETVPGHGADERVIGFLGGTPVLVGRQLIIFFLKIERGQLIFRGLAYLLVKPGIEGDLAEFFFRGIEFAQRQIGFAEEDMCLGDIFAVGVELDDLFEFALRLAKFAAVEKALPDHNQGVIDPAALGVILEDAGSFFDRLLIVLHLGGGGTVCRRPLHGLALALPLQFFFG